MHRSTLQPRQQVEPSAPSPARWLAQARIDALPATTGPAGSADSFAQSGQRLAIGIILVDADDRLERRHIGDVVTRQYQHDDIRIEGAKRLRYASSFGGPQLAAEMFPTITCR